MPIASGNHRAEELPGGFCLELGDALDGLLLEFATPSGVVPYRLPPSTRAAGRAAPRLDMGRLGSQVSSSDDDGSSSAQR
jgi:hypothetical protein